MRGLGKMKDKRAKFSINSKELTFLLVLVFFGGFLGILPLIIKPTNPFYIVDPGPAYLANALEFLQIRKIFITDHPGTPLVLYLFLILAPIKFFVKLAGFSSFTLWALKNFTMLYWISIFSVFFVFLVGLFFLHLAIYKAFRSYLANFFLFFLLFLNPMFLRMQRIVTPEAIAFFFMAIWLNILVIYSKRKRLDGLVIAGIFAGLAASSKLTFLFIPLATIAFSFFHKNNSSRKLRLFIKPVFYTTISILTGFFLGTVAILKRYESFLGWIIKLFTRTGRSGGGEVGFVSILNFKLGLKIWFGQNPVFLLSLLIFSLAFFKRKKDSRLWATLFLAGLAGLFVFMKYTELHYQTANIFLISISMVYVFSKLGRKFQLAILSLAILFVIPRIKLDLIRERYEVIQAFKLQQFVNELPKNSILIWEFGTTKEYALIRGRDWSHYFYIRELEEVIPKTWLLYYKDMTRILDNSGHYTSINNFCWDGMVIRKSIWEKFIKQQENSDGFIKKEIPDTEMFFVEQKECS